MRFDAGPLKQIIFADARDRLSLDEHKEAFAQLVGFDRAVCRIGLDAAKKYIETLGKAGAAELRKRLTEFDVGSKDAELYRTTDGKYRDVEGDEALRQSGVKLAASVKAAFPGD
jgi:hypothetical protein